MPRVTCCFNREQDQAPSLPCHTVRVFIGICFQMVTLDCWWLIWALKPSALRLSGTCPVSAPGTASHSSVQQTDSTFSLPDGQFFEIWGHDLLAEGPERSSGLPGPCCLTSLRCHEARPAGGWALPLRVATSLSPCVHSGAGRWQRAEQDLWSD